MDRTFSNTDAIICGVIAFTEVVFLFIYIPVTTARLRKRVISLGRLIPAVPVVIVGGNLPITGYIPPNINQNVQTNPPYPVNVAPHPYQNYPPNPYQNMNQMPQPMQAGASNPSDIGFQRPDLPPPYPGYESKPQPS